jgi:hypothetical protein
MSRTSFWFIHNIIKDDPVFQSIPGRKPQRKVDQQLCTFLVKWGEFGGVKTATVLGISEGAVMVYCQRAILALNRRREAYLYWPGAERRAHIKHEMSLKGFAGCIGAIDGTLFCLAFKPRCPYPNSYFCRKDFFAVSL